MRNPIKKTLTAAFAVAFGLCSMATHAGQQDSVEILRETTQAILDTLVEQGLLTREKADALVKSAQERGAQTARQKMANEETVKPGVVRVPYVPESVKAELREQIKQEVLATAKNENWAQPNAIPDWIGRVQWEGDLRLRYQRDDLNAQNTLPAAYTGQDLLTRAPAFATINSSGVPTGNTVEDRTRWRVRARLGLKAKLTDDWQVGVRIATGATSSGPVATNQTLGQNTGNPYQLVLDRAYTQYKFRDYLTFNGGRFANPFFSTNLIWHDDLNFDGVALTGRYAIKDVVEPYVTFGYFPLRENNPPAAAGRNIKGLQIGFNSRWTGNTQFSLGVAQYEFSNFEGRIDTDSDFLGGAANIGQYEYASSMRQKGNTLFRTNAIADTSNPTRWGLASKFRVQSLTAALELSHFNPVKIKLIGEFVRNAAFNREEMRQRTGFDITDGDNKGQQVRVIIGASEVRKRNDWQLSLAYRRVGSDAVLDAFTDSDLGLGGTNLRGYSFGFIYGVADNVSLGLRHHSARSLASPTLRTNGESDKFGADVTQFELMTRF